MLVATGVVTITMATVATLDGTYDKSVPGGATVTVSGIIQATQ